MNDVRRPPCAGQEPRAEHRLPRPIDLRDAAVLDRWRRDARAIVNDVRLLAFDAAAPRGKRTRAKQALRESLRARFRALEERIAEVRIVAPEGGAHE
jgi:hypothetical protein